MAFQSPYPAAKSNTLTSPREVAELFTLGYIPSALLFLDAVGGRLAEATVQAEMVAGTFLLWLHPFRRCHLTKTLPLSVSRSL